MVNLKWLTEPKGLHPWRWRFLFAWVIAFTVITGYVLHEQGILIRKGEQAHDAGCALRANLEDQIAVSRQYLSDVTDHKRDPVPGITRNDILAGIKRSQITVSSLKPLRCP